MIYDNERNANKAEEQARGALLQILRGSKDVPNQFIPQSHAPGLDTDIQGAHSMGTRWTKEDKFSGKLVEDLNEAINFYTDATNDYELFRGQKLKYFHNVFNGEARSFYCPRVETNAHSFAEASYMMRDKRNSVVRQNRVRKLLQSLRLKKIIDKKNRSVTEALKELREAMTKFSSQVPRVYRTEKAKVEYMYYAVIGNKRAGNALSKAMSAPEPSFQQLYADLDSTWLREQQKIEGRRRDGVGKISDSDIPTLPDFHFQGQGTYGRPRKTGSKSFSPVVQGRIGRNGTKKFGSPRLCHGRGIPDHMICNCQKRKIKGQTVNNVAR